LSREIKRLLEEFDLKQTAEMQAYKQHQEVLSKLDESSTTEEQQQTEQPEARVSTPPPSPKFKLFS
jgi:hypothetical protein